jgi:EPSP synthase (3-phosphoshikimate 1-carboxyvinyltransferase)
LSSTTKHGKSVCHGRPLCAAVAAAGRGRFVLDGVARMRERPIADLVDGLKQLGVDATCTAGTGCPPVLVNANGLPSGTVSTTVSLLWYIVNAIEQLNDFPAYMMPHCRFPASEFAMQVEISGSVSSQYLTALLMAAPLATGDAGVEIRITDELVSQPYVDMTVRLMERFGVKVRHHASKLSISNSALQLLQGGPTSAFASCRWRGWTGCSTCAYQQGRHTGRRATHMWRATPHQLHTSWQAPPSLAAP